MDLSQPVASELNLELPYRPCVGIMLINRDGLVWVGRRLPKWVGDRSGYIWQMPQGGIAGGEPARTAALRELEEETAVRSVEIIAEAPGWLSYDLPTELLGVALKGRYRGQRQKWFAMRFLGEDREIDISAAQWPQGRVRRLALGAHDGARRFDHALQKASLSGCRFDLCALRGLNLPVQAGSGDRSARFSLFPVRQTPCERCGSTPRPAARRRRSRSGG